MSKICVIDDDETIRKFIVSSLEYSGYEVIDYDSAKDFIPDYQHNAFDLIIIDIVIGSMALNC